MKYRTDLAVETVEGLKNSGIKPGEKDGIIVSEEEIDDQIHVTRVQVTSLKGEALTGRPRGNYTTIEVKALMEGDTELAHRAAKVLAAQLSAMLRHAEALKVLVIGLGNEKITPDSLGPVTVGKIKVTRHLFTCFQLEHTEAMANVCALAPGVMAVTGIETAELVKRVVDLTAPDVVIAIDALAARNIERVTSTIQLCDTGISPGAGMGNMRKALNAETLGCKVIAIGIPTVIDAQTLILEAAEAMSLPPETIETYLENRQLDMVVTSTDIDFAIKGFSEIIANGVNDVLHPGIYS